jgi:hypothetical protein
VSEFLLDVNADVAELLCGVTPSGDLGIDGGGGKFSGIGGACRPNLNLFVVLEVVVTSAKVAASLTGGSAGCFLLKMPILENYEDE